jgi:hypothetical protein
VNQRLTTNEQGEGLYARWTHFWFTSSNGLSLHMARVLLGLLGLVWLLSYAGHVTEFFGYEGWFDRAAFLEAGNLAENQSWSLIYLVAHDTNLLNLFYWASVAVLALFTLGFFTRITSVLAWLIIVSFSANPLIEADTDVFLRLAFFYLMFGYVLMGLLDWDSPVQLVLGSSKHWVWKMLYRDDATTSFAATMALRLLQMHFALALVMMALHKLQIMEWWSGVAYWFPIHRTSTLSVEAINEMRTYAPTYLNSISLAAYAVLVWQIFFPTFAWRTGWPRWILLGGAVAGMIGLIIIYPIPLLGPMFFLLCLVYLTDAEWKTVLSPLMRLVNGGA